MKITTEQYEVSKSGCWVWKGAKNSDGYGLLGRIRAHRAAYEQWIAAIPEGRQIDHLCRNRLCINPEHLEVVTQKENILRGEGITAKQKRQTHCKRGHPLDEKNTLRYRGKRICIMCKKRHNKTVTLDRYIKRKFKK